MKPKGPAGQPAGGHASGETFDLFAPKAASSHKAISDALSKEINGHRGRLGPYFNGVAKGNPTISFAGDGTGFGKSYSVFAQYIDNSELRNRNGGHHNLFFMTPQKAQINIDKALEKRAEVRGIKILSFLAQSDLSDLDFTGWVSKKRNQDLYLSWADVLQKKPFANYYGQAAAMLGSTVHRLRAVICEIDRLEGLREAEKWEIDDLIKQRGRLQYTIRHSLRDLALLILREEKGEKPISVSSRFATAKGKELVLVDIIDHILPFERAKIGPTILLATTSKFIHPCFVADVSRQGEPIIVGRTFDNIIGGKIPVASEVPSDDDPISTIGSVCSLKFDEQVAYLRERFYRPDAKNFFRANNISFSLVIDEEHDSYEVMNKEAHKQLIGGDQVNLAHLFAAVSRLLAPLDEDFAPGEEPILLKKRLAYRDHIFKLHRESCEPTVDLKSILDMCAGNVSQISIAKGEVEQILSLTRNIFSFSSKRFYNESSLKKIRVRSMFKGTELRLYFDDGRVSTDPTLYDMLQVLLCVFCASAHLPANENHIEQLMMLGAAPNQNIPLTEFIRSAREHKAYAQSLFERAKDPNLIIDEFFTYFAPKVVFSLCKVETLPKDFTEDVMRGNVPVDFKLELILELPEVSILRATHNTQNAAISLSATTGFKGSYSGNYARSMLKRFGESAQASLNVSVLERSGDDVVAMADLREARAKARSLAVRPFHDSGKDEISDYRQDATFREELKVWKSIILERATYDNAHRRKALARQVEAMLMAAWDEKNTLVLSLNNRFTALYLDFLRKNKKGRMKRHWDIISERTGNPIEKIFEIQPFNGKAKLRVILYDASLAKQVDVEQYLRVDANTRVCMIASYQSAGTGLNLFVKHAGDVQANGEEFAEDIERLVLVNAPFYSSIKKPDVGLNTIANHILLLKHTAANGGTRLDDFDNNLLQSKNNRILMAEHDLDVLKKLMQAVGRIERRDTLLQSEIYLPDDVVDDLIVRYSRLRRGGNDLVINSLSLLNHRLMQFCLARAEERAFPSEAERERFADQVQSDAVGIDEFFLGSFRNKILQEARKGNIDAVSFNEAIRSELSITNPKKYVAELLKQPLVRASTYYANVVKKFYLPQDVTDRYTICTTDEGQYRLGDLRNGSHVYAPGVWIVPEYVRSRDEAANQVAPGIVNYACRMADGGIDSCLPNPALIPLLKGNLGESMFSKCLDAIGVKPLTIKEVFDLVGSPAYERYDVYVLNGDELICIDVKNWSMTLDTYDMSMDLVESADEKRKVIDRICKSKGLKPRFLYVNTKPNINEVNSEREHDCDKPIHFLNAFKLIDTSMLANTTPLERRVVSDLKINPTLIKLLGASK